MSDPNQEFQAPPPPPFAPTPEPPKVEMSTAATLTGIFFEPGQVFEALRSRPRFLVAGLILMLLTIGVVAVLYQRVDMGEFIREQMDKSPQAAQLSPDQKEQRVKIGKIAGAIVFPAIAAGQSRLRFMMNAHHTVEQMDGVVDALRRAMP